MNFPRKGDRSVGNRTSTCMGLRMVNSGAKKNTMTGVSESWIPQKGQSVDRSPALGSMNKPGKRKPETPSGSPVCVEAASEYCIYCYWSG